MGEKLKEVLDMTRNAYDLTELIPVSGQNLDRLAAARQELRSIHQNVTALLAEVERGKENG